MKLNHTRPSANAMIVLLYAAIAMFFFIFNPQALKFDYGDGNGRFADRVDSYSEYIVRNTVKRNILVKEDNSFFPIITKGYAESDYKFYADKYKKYTSNLSLQTGPVTLIAKLLNFNTEKKLDMLFGLLRLVNALVFSCLLCTFLFYFCKFQQLKHHFLVPFLVGGSAGFMFFSQNLYFVSALMLMPAALIAYQMCNKGCFSKVIVFVLGLVFFLRGYEFATIFALLTGFSAALFATGDWYKRAKVFALAFSLICAAFIVAILCHIILISADSGWTLSVSDAAKQAFYNVQLRTSSINGVPVPLGPAFLHAMNERWSTTAFSIIQSGLKLTELDVLLLMALILVVRLKTMLPTEKMIVAYGGLGYLSWYVFAYQHIMWHQMYEWYIFSLTMGLAFSLLIIIYLNAFIEFVLKSYRGKVAKID